MLEIFISIGSNLGKREENLKKAKQLLKEHSVQIIRESSIYETEPFGYPDQNFFLNQVVSVSTKKSPEALLETCLSIENEMKRQRAGKYGPRIIDIDLLFYKDFVLNTKTLTLPHPEIPYRRFILLPLSEIAPEMQGLLDACTDHRIVESYRNHSAHERLPYQ